MQFNIITGDITKPLSDTSKKQLFDLGVEPALIAFFEQYNGQEMYNEMCYINQNAGIARFSYIERSLKEREERRAIQNNENVFESSLVFAYGHSPYEEFTYMISGPQKGLVLKVIINHIDLKTVENSFVIDNHSVQLLGNSFADFANHLTMIDVEVINLEITKRQLLLTKINGNKTPVLHFLKQEKIVKDHKEAKNILEKLPIDLGSKNIDKRITQLSSLGCNYRIEKITEKIT